MMKIEKTRSFIEDNLNKKINFKFNGNRNMVEEFSGEIVKTYKCVFLVKVDNQDVLRSFSYSDVLIGSLELFV